MRWYGTRLHLLHTMFDESVRNSSQKSGKKADANPFRCRYAAAGEQINYWSWVDLGSMVMVILNHGSENGKVFRVAGCIGPGWLLGYTAWNELGWVTLGHFFRWFM